MNHDAPPVSSVARDCIGGDLCRAAPAGRPPLKVVATTEDLGSLAREIGGDRIAVDIFSRGYQDPHFVEPKPSFILKLVNADLLIVVGRELEIGWLPPLLTQSRNAQDPAGRPRLSRRVCDGEDSRHSDRADHPGDGRRPPVRAIRTTGSTPTTAA